MAESEAQIYEKLEAIEKEIAELKNAFISSISMPPKRLVSLKGILKGMRVSEDEIEKAKKAPFKAVI